MKIFEHTSMNCNPLFILTTFLIFMGVQFIVLGLLRTECQDPLRSTGKPIYVVKEKIILADPSLSADAFPTPYFADRAAVRIYEEACTSGISAMMSDRYLPPGATWPVFRLPIPSVPWYGKLSAGPSWHKPYLDLLLFFKAVKVHGHSDRI
jgi:hypothetical protein